MDIKQLLPGDRGYYAIACEDQFSGSFMKVYRFCVANIMVVKEPNKHKVVQSQCLQNLRIKMRDWVAMKEEEFHTNTKPFLLDINGEMGKNGIKMWFSDNSVKAKKIRSTKLDELNAAVAANVRSI